MGHRTTPFSEEPRPLAYALSRVAPQCAYGLARVIARAAGAGKSCAWRIRSQAAVGGMKKPPTMPAPWMSMAVRRITATVLHRRGSRVRGARRNRSSISRAFRVKSIAFQKGPDPVLSPICAISLSTNGCEHGTQGTALISSTSKTRRFARQRPKRNNGSLSEDRFFGRN